MDVFQDKKNLYKVRETIQEMISDRGFNIPESEKITFEQFIIKYTNKNLDMVINDIENKKIFYVYFHNEVKNFSKADLKNIMQKITGLFNDQDINIILILKDKENSAISKELTKDIYKNVEIFLKNNMVFNITHHELVPQHILLSLDEEKELLEKYNTSKGKLPKILKTDPIAKYYGAKTDQIFKIIRKSPSVGEAFYYRLVR
jgi:DNA-directed RNA polymerase I, II, and III subunit RPABC1